MNYKPHTNKNELFSTGCLLSTCLKSLRHRPNMIHKSQHSILEQLETKQKYALFQQKERTLKKSTSKLSIQ